VSNDGVSGIRINALSTSGLGWKPGPCSDAEVLADTPTGFEAADRAPNPRGRCAVADSPLAVSATARRGPLRSIRALTSSEP